MGKFSLNALLNEQSVRPKAEQGREPEKVPLCKLRPSSMNVYSIKDIEDLAANIEMVGLLHNLVVTAPDADGMHDIISGERRYWACKLLADGGNDEYREVYCRVSASSDGDTITELKLLFANALARELSDYEKTYQAGRIKELLLQLKAEGYKFKGRMRDTMASFMGVSPAQMGRMEGINKHLSEGFMNAFKAGDIGITAAYDLSTMTEEEQAAAFDTFAATGELPVKQKPNRTEHYTAERAGEALHEAGVLEGETSLDVGEALADVAPQIAEAGRSLMEEAKELARTTPLSLEGAAASITSAKANESVTKGLQHTEQAQAEAPAQSGYVSEPQAPTSAAKAGIRRAETRHIDTGVCPACGSEFLPADVIGGLDRVATAGNTPCPHCGVLLKVGMCIEYICSVVEATNNLE